MENAGHSLVKQVFVKVFGFTDVERHALNTVFRLSWHDPDRAHAYVLWTEDAPAEAGLALVDGDSWEASLALAKPENDGIGLIWAGEQPPPHARLAFTRPLRWAAIVEGMDATLRTPEAAQAADVAQDTTAQRVVYAQLHGGLSPQLDLPVELSEPETAANWPIEAPPGQTDTQPSALSPPADSPTQALIVDTDRAARLYWRAKLALAGVFQVHEASCGAEALHLLRTGRYRLVIVDLGLSDIDGWKVARRAGQSGVLILTGHRLSWMHGVRGWFTGARRCVRKPFHPGSLHHLLLKVS